MNEVLRTAIKAVDDKKAIDVVVMDISGVASFADYFLVCSGDSTRQIQAIADEVEARLAECGYRPAHIEGYRNAEWILLDYLGLVVHIFSKQARSYYDLERLWRDAKLLDVSSLSQEEETERPASGRTRRRRS